MISRPAPTTAWRSEICSSCRDPFAASRSAFSEQVLNRLEALYGPVPMRVELTKCAAPVPGFSGVVSVERFRHHQLVLIDESPLVLVHASGTPRGYFGG